MYIIMQNSPREPGKDNGKFLVEVITVLLFDSSQEQGGPQLGIYQDNMYQVSMTSVRFKCVELCIKVRKM